MFLENIFFNCEVRNRVEKLYVIRNEEGELEVYHNDCYLTDFLKAFCPTALAQIEAYYEEQLKKDADLEDEDYEAWFAINNY